MNDTLLPPNATRQEVALDLTTARLSDIPTPLRDLWDPDRCPTTLLPWLGWALGVDEWDEQWSDEAKRNTIRDSVLVQRRKGSVWSVRRVLRNAGYGEVELHEGGIADDQYNGEFQHNHQIKYGGVTTGWALYSIYLPRPINVAQANQIRGILAFTAPARCHLEYLRTETVGHLYNDEIDYDGAFNHGDY